VQYDDFLKQNVLKNSIFCILLLLAVYGWHIMKLISSPYEGFSGCYMNGVERRKMRWS